MTNDALSNYILPNWPAPKTIHSITTTRLGGVSQGPYASFNVGMRSGDQPEHVDKNRRLLQNNLKLPSQPLWLKQTHSNFVLSVDDYQTDQEADGLYANTLGQVCAVMTADCLPILLCNQAGTEIAALHAGWRGLAFGVVENGLQHFQDAPEKLLAWLGPAIGPEKFEVGAEVREAFLNNNQANELAFIPLGHDKWLANLYMLAKQRLIQLGVTAIYGGDYCTFTDQKRFYSYRRDGQHTGRMASLIWLT